MDKPYASGHQSVNHQSTPPSDDDIPSTTVREGDSSCESKHLILLLSRKCNTDVLFTTALLDNGSPASSTRPDRTLRSWCYTLHAFLVAIHAALAAMFFTHPEHRLSVSIDNTTATIVLKVFLQHFTRYACIYTAVLVFIVQRLAIYAAMAKQQKLTTIHDVHGAWNSIGAAIHTLWQQSKVMSSPSMILLVLAYLSCISGLHIISSSVIQFKTFNSTVMNVVPSTLAWPYSSLNLTSIDWASVSPLAALLPLLSSAKGLSGNVLYDVPISNDPYIEAVVNTTSISADCGLLSNSLVGKWDSNQSAYLVNVSGLGEVTLNVPGPNLVSLFDSIQSSCSLCNNYNYIFSQISTNVDLGNLTGQVIQLDVDVLITTSDDFKAPSEVTVPNTSFFVACTLNTTNAIQNLSMQNGQIILNKESTPEPSSWKIWSPGSTTELTQMFNTAQQEFVSLPLACLKTQLSPSGQQCDFISVVDLFLNRQLGIPWVYGSATTAEVPSIALESKKFEDSIAQIAAKLIWLASIVAIAEGTQQIEGKSPIIYLVLEQRLNVNMIPAILGLFTSFILFIVMAWMLHGPYPRVSRKGITSPSILELMWISANSTTFQGFMTRIGNAIPDQLRIEGTKTEVCLLNLDIGTTKLYRDEDNNLKSGSTIYNWSQLYKKGLFNILNKIE
ncbi:hypothetical protein EV363DRAFT_1546024, partial [Boletus edulis]